MTLKVKSWNLNDVKVKKWNLNDVKVDLKFKWCKSKELKYYKGWLKFFFFFFMSLLNIFQSLSSLMSSAS